MIKLDRLPPANLEAEVGVLGSALLDNDVIDDVAAILDPADFYRDAHAAAWRAIIALVDAGAPVDAVSLLEHLRASGTLAAVGGQEAILEWLRDTPHSANATYYAGLVRQKAISRRLIEMANDILRDGYSDQHDAAELLQRADLGLARVADGSAHKELATIGDAIRDSLRRRALRDAGQEQGTPTGFKALNRLIGGFRPGQLIVLGARPGLGKTSIALQMLESAAILAPGSALFVSLEMGLGELGDRAVVAKVGIDSATYRDDVRYDPAAFAARVAEMEGLPILIEETPGLTPSQIASVARRARRRGPLSLVVVDYLQIVGSDDRRASEYDRVGAASMALKNLAKQVGAPVVALSQLNRQVEEREDKRPKLADLRATGQIEQDADVVAFLYRQGYYDKEWNSRAAELLVAKNRHGATGMINLNWDGPLMRFDDPEAEDQGGSF